MATISTTFKAIDQISPALQKINSNLGGIISSAQKVDNTINGIDSKSLDKVSKAVQGTDQELNSLVGGAENADSALDGIDGKGLDSVVGSAKQVDSVLNNLQSGARGTDQALDSIDGNSINTAANSVRQADSALNSLENTAKGTDSALDGIDGSNIASLAGSAKQADSALDGVEIGAKETGEAIESLDSKKVDDVANAARNADSAMKGLSNGSKEAAQNVDKVEQASKKLSSTGKALKGVGSVFSSLGKVGSVVTGALTGITTAAVNTSKNFIKLYESSQVVFKQMLGGEEAAKKMYTSLLDIAKASTFSQEAFLNAGKSLVGVGVSAENTTKYLQAISDAVTGFGGDAQDIEQITNAFRKVSTNGKLSMEEVNMMADANINVLKILGNQYGVSTEEMREMISSGAVPAEEALGKLTDGIEKGTDGVNGMTQAMEGMSKAMKGKTLTGALDSMNSSIRSFSLNLLAMNPTLKESDEGYAENQKRISQLTAAITKINTIIEKSVPLFKGITDGVGALLDKLIGTQPVFNEATGQWEQTGGILTKIQTILEQTDPDKLARLGNVFLSVGGTAPVLLGAGKAIKTIGTAIDDLSKKKEILSKIFNTFSSKPKEQDETKETKATQTQKKTKSSLSLPNLSAPFKSYLDKIKSFGTEVSAATDNAATTSSNAMKQSFGRGINSFMASIRDSFEQGKSKVDVGGFFSNLVQNFTNGVGTLGTNAKTAIDKNGLLINSAFSNSLDDTGKGGFIKNTFSKLTQATNTETVSFGQKFKASITNAIPKGDTFFDKFKSSVTNLGTSLGATAQAAGGALKKLIPDNLITFFSSKLQGVVGLFGKLPGSIGKLLGPLGTLVTNLMGPLSSLFGTFSGIVSQAFSAIMSALSPVLSFLEPVLLAFNSLNVSFLAFGGYAGLAVTAIGAVVGALGLLNQGGQAASAIEGFFKGFNEKISQFGTLAVTGIQTFVQNLIANFPTLVAQGSQLIVSLITGIATTLPNLIATGATIVIELITGLMQALPSLISGGFQAIQAVAEGIGQNSSTIWTAIQNALSTIANAVQTNLPTIIESGKQILNNLISGFSQLVPQLWEWGVTAIINLVGFIASALPNVIQAGCNIISSLVSGIAQYIPVLITTGVQMITSLIGTIWEHRGEILQVGGQLIMSLITGIVSLTGTLISSVIQIGGALIQGLWDGINVAWSSFVGWLSSTFGGLIDTVKGIFGVASPSTIFSDIGGFLIEGLKNGVQAMWGAVSGIFQGIADTIIGMFQPKDQVDYTDMIAQTEAQLDDLKAKVQAGYEELKNLTLANNQQMAEGTMIIFQNMTSAVLGQVGVMVNQLAQLISTIPVNFTATFTTLISNTTTYLESLKTATFEQINSMIAGMQEPLNQVTAIFVTVFEQTRIQTITFFQTLQSQALAQIALLTSAINLSLQGLALGFTTSFTNMVMSALGSLEILRAGTVEKMTQIRDETAAIFAVMQSSFSGVFVAITTEIITQIQIMKDSVLQTVGAMNQGLIDSVNVFRTQYQGAWSGVIASVLGIIDGFTASVGSKIGSMLMSLQSSLSIFKDTAIGIFQQLSNGVMPIINNLVDSIKKKMDELPPHFKRIGETMMSDLKSGIDAKTQEVINATNSLVEKLKQTFITGLGIHSPSRFMTYVGQMMAQGLMNGLSQQQMKKFAEAVIGDMKNSFKEGNFDPNQLVDYLGQDTEKVIQYLIDTGDNTVSEATGAVGGVPPIIEAARKHLGYKSNGTSIFGAKYGDPGGAWCAYFVRSAAEEAGVPFPASGFVPTIRSWAQSNGRWTQTPVPGYAAIFGDASHIELVSDVAPNGDVTCIGGNTGTPRGVYERVRNGATGYVALDGGRPVAQTLKDVITRAYIDKMLQIIGSGGTVNMESFAKFFPGYTGVANLDITGSGLDNPPFFQRWTPPPAVARWAPQSLQALAILGEPASLLKGVLWAINGESSGNDKDINLWDSNAAIGDPTKGLLQIMMANFKPRSQGGWGVEGFTNNIWDPLQNILTGLGEMKWKLGGIAKVINERLALGRWKGYAKGTDNATPGLHWVGENGPELLQFSGGERVYTNKESKQIVQSTALNNYIPGYAKGTDNATPGLHWVGENGPELLQFNGGEQVYTNKESKQIVQSTALNNYIPGFAKGSKRIPEDMIAMIHEGESILPKSQNPYSESGGNYLKEIGNTIGIEVLQSAMDFDALPMYYPQYFETGSEENTSNQDTLNYDRISADYNRNRVVTVSANTGSESPINIEVNINTVNNSGDLDNIEDLVVQKLTNAIERTSRATGAVLNV